MDEKKEYTAPEMIEVLVVEMLASGKSAHSCHTDCGPGKNIFN